MIQVGRLFYLIVWGFLILNLFHPYPGAAKMLAYIALGAMIMTHSLQAWILNSTLTEHERRKDRFITLRLFLFGIVEALSWKKSKKQQ
ncbi:MAG: DUF1145 domain-containing protein [Candidatus Schmidhempelia sp.]|nr:DUF1145 domain-containing protein [Candidatus Schmidhempelia sp.]